MSRARFLLVNGFIAGYLVLTALLFATGYELWPVCTYWMYENVMVRGNENVIEYYTVAEGREKWIDIQSGPLLPWVPTLSVVAKQDGWSGAHTKKFFLAALEQLRSENRADDPGAPLPTAIRAYITSYHFPDSGDYQPIRTARTLLLEVDRPQP